MRWGSTVMRSKATMQAYFTRQASLIGRWAETPLFFAIVAELARLGEGSRYDGNGVGREKGVDVRIALEMARLGRKGLFDGAVVVSEDSDLDEAETQKSSPLNSRRCRHGRVGDG